MSVLSRLERITLAAVVGFGFMFVATVLSPGLQTLVAPVVCPASAQDGAVVVRYPHVVEPPEMVRNTPLVCLGPDGAVLASHWRVLPALFVLGTAAGGVAILGLSLVASVGRRGSVDPSQPPTWATNSVRFLPLVIVAPFVGMTAYGAYWWLAVDTPYRVTSCESSEGGTATCFDGEPVYRLLTGIFGLMALIGLTIWLVMLVRSAQRQHRYRAALADGGRAPAVLEALDPTNTTIKGRRLYRYRYRVEPPDGSPPFDLVEKHTTTPAGSAGGRVEVVYERGRTSNAFVVRPPTS